MAQPLLLALWLALGVAPSVVGVAPAGTSEPPTAPTAAPTEAETLQSEADNQENVLSQVGAVWPPARPPGGPSPGGHLSLIAECFLGEDMVLRSKSGSSRRWGQEERGGKNGDPGLRVGRRPLVCRLFVGTGM